MVVENNKEEDEYVGFGTSNNNIRRSDCRENNILVRNKKQHLDSKLRSAIIASHAVAHQWFGNLVTPKWWSNVWLKEGFSSFFGIKTLSMVRTIIFVIILSRFFFTSFYLFIFFFLFSFL